MELGVFADEFNSFADDCLKLWRSKLDPIADGIQTLRRKGYSFRKIAQLLVERGFKVAHTTIWYWWERMMNVAPAMIEPEIASVVERVVDQVIVPAVAPVVAPAVAPADQDQRIQSFIRAIPKPPEKPEGPYYDACRAIEQEFVRKSAMARRVALFRQKYNRGPKTEQELEDAEL